MPWIDFLVDKGALYGWIFLYMPVGRDPDAGLMPTPEQRDKLRVFVRKVRQERPIIPIDFWNDGPLAGSCLAGGRHYFHVNHRGEVEPCIFCHFTTHNVNTSSIGEILSSPFFKSIREHQPLSYNTLLPCPMIDHPETLWKLIQEYGARPTHEGAEKMFTDLAPQIARVRPEGPAEDGRRLGQRGLPAVGARLGQALRLAGGKARRAPPRIRALAGKGTVRES